MAFIELHHKDADTFIVNTKKIVYIRTWWHYDDMETSIHFGNDEFIKVDETSSEILGLINAVESK